MKSIRIHIIIFASLLIISGVTAFPLRDEIRFLYLNTGLFPDFTQTWISRVYTDLNSTPKIMFYGTDWLAFAHIVIALFFVPVFLLPAQHIMNVQIAMVACILILPLAFVCGTVREIPFFHQLTDCMFGVLGFLYLAFIHKKIKQLKIISQ